MWVYTYLKYINFWESVIYYVVHPEKKKTQKQMEKSSRNCNTRNHQTGRLAIFIGPGVTIIIDMVNKEIVK